MRGEIFLLLMFTAILIIPFASGVEYISIYAENGDDIYNPLYLDQYASCEIYSTCHFNYSSHTTVQSKFYSNYTNHLYNVNTAGGEDVFCGDYDVTADEMYEGLRINLENTDITYLTTNVTCPQRDGYVVYNFTTSAEDEDGYLSNVMGSDDLTVFNSTIYENRDTEGEIFRVNYPMTYGQGATADLHEFIVFDSGYGYPEIWIYRKAMGCNPTPYFNISVYEYHNSSNLVYNQYDTSGITSDETYNLTSIDMEDHTLHVLELHSHCYTANPTYPQVGAYGYIRVFDYASNISCGEWSECNNVTGQIKRLCTDTNGLVDDYYEYQSCPTGTGVTAFDEFVYMGFRNLTTMEVPVCVPNWTITGCQNFVTNKTVTVPANWNFTNIFSMGYANYPEGFDPYRVRAWVDLAGFKMKMWNTVPKPYEAMYNYSGTNAWECVNYTGWSPQWATKDITNSSVASEFDITFPEENMKMWFTIKKCNEQVKQYSHDDCSYFFGLGAVGDLCYSSSCEDTVRGGYKFSIYDYNNSEYMFAYDGEATDEWRQYFFDLSNETFIEGNTYRITLETHDPDYTDEGTCLELWDFGYGISSDAFSCEDYCDPATFHYMKARNTADGLCVHEDQGYTSDCLSNIAYDQYYQNCESFCDDAGDYHIGTNATGLCFWELEEDASICEDKKDIYDTLLPDDQVEYLESQGLSIVSKVASVFGFIILIIVGILLWATRGKNADGSSQGTHFGALLVAVAILGYALVVWGVLDPFVVIIIIIVLGWMFARSMVDSFTSKG